MGENQDDLEAFMQSFDPHISLAYSESFSKSFVEVDLQKKIETALGSLDLTDAFQFIVLMNTNATENEITQQVKSWKACPIRMAM